MPADRTVWFLVGDIVKPGDSEPYAVFRVDTSERRGDGVEGVVESLHWSREVAQAIADRQNRMIEAGMLHA